MKYLFGPVNSRRLGISLGIDLVPHKTCSLDCVYCECGVTTNLTTELREYVPTVEVIDELDKYLKEGPRLDVLTFSGSGEPTLHSGLGEVARFLKERYPQYPLCVLTNGTLLYKKEVRDALMHVDTVVPSLDAVTPGAFKKMCRPAPGLDPEEIVKGLETFKKDYKGRILLEVFLVPGVNDTDEELALLRQAALRIKPDLVQLNRLDRPGTVDWVEPFPWDEFLRVKDFLFPLAVEVIGKPDPNRKVPASVKEQLDMIKSILRRRPSTVEDLAHMLGLRHVEVQKLMRQIENEGTLAREEMERGVFYHLKDI